MNRSDLFDIFKLNEKNKPALEKDIIEAESIIGFELPQSFKDLLRRSNGGIVRFRYLKSLEIDFDVISGVIEGDYKIETNNVLHDFFPKSIIEFATNGYFRYCFDYGNLNKKSEPTIVLIDFEVDKAGEIYESFEELLEDLSEEPK